MQQTDPAQSKTQIENKKREAREEGRFSHWIVICCALLLGILYYALPQRLRITPSWILLLIEGIIILPLLLSGMIRGPLPRSVVWPAKLLLLGIVTIALLIGVVLLITTLGNPHTRGENLLITAASMWVFNIVVFGLWYWEIDGGGPYMRHLKGHQAADFMFPQQVDGNKTGWVPGFLDYLFLGFTGATALSPADTYPLTQRAKILMMIEAIIALMILAILAGRAVNIL